MVLTPEQKESLQKIAITYNIDLSHPEKYDITNPEVARQVTEDIARARFSTLADWQRDSYLDSITRPFGFH